MRLVHTGGVEPTAEEVRRQLDRILASDLFANADRLSRFLRFVVERTLAGEGDQLKEYAVGVGVFDRGEQYDPRVDSIVRVEASRLRTKIDEYYRSTNGADSVVIRLPKGTYTPEFEARPPSIVDSPQTSGVTVAVAPEPVVDSAILAAVVVLVVIALTAARTRNQPAASSSPLSPLRCCRSRSSRRIRIFSYWRRKSPMA